MESEEPRCGCDTAAGSMDKIAKAISVINGIVHVLDERITKIESDSSDLPCYAGVARHLEDEAAKIEAAALPEMQEGFFSDGYTNLRLSSSLRTAANFLDGVKSA